MSQWDIDVAFPEHHREITPSDTVDLERPMIIVAMTDGDIALVDKNEVVIVYSVTAGWNSPIAARRVNETDTDAAVIGIY